MAATGPQVIPDPTGNHDWLFTWANGTIAATLHQAILGAQDLIKNQIASGQINNGSSVTIDAKNNFKISITKTVTQFIFSQDVVMHVAGNLVPSADGKSTVFNFTSGSVDAGGNAQQSDVVKALRDTVAQWQTQAQKEPPQASTHSFRGMGE